MLIPRPFKTASLLFNRSSLLEWIKFRTPGVEKQVLLGDKLARQSPGQLLRLLAYPRAQISWIMPGPRQAQDLVNKCASP